MSPQMLKEGGWKQVLVKKQKPTERNLIQKMPVPRAL